MAQGISCVPNSHVYIVDTRAENCKVLTLKDFTLAFRKQTIIQNKKIYDMSSVFHARIGVNVPGTDSVTLMESSVQHTKLCSLSLFSSENTEQGGTCSRSSGGTESGLPAFTICRELQRCVLLPPLPTHIVCALKNLGPLWS